MKCKCGFEGEPEYGDFKDKELLAHVHIRCPQCKSTRHIVIEDWERIKMAILYPEHCYGSPDWRAMHGAGHMKTQKVIQIHLDGSYSIYCPVCHWGEGGGFMPKDKTEELRKLFVERQRE